MTQRELAARICEEMRPSGGRMWTPEQAAVYEALTVAADLIRNPDQIAKQHAENIYDDTRFSRATR